MYGKIFAAMYKGTLFGHWEAIVTFQQLIVLADADGIVDMTPQAIFAHTSIPLDIIEKGLKKLSEPDPYSRTPGEEGRRIVCIDAHRPWGWQIVNYLKYKHLKDSNEVRAQTRERVRKHREKRNDEKRDVTGGNAELRHTDTDTDTDTKNNKAEKPPADAGPVWKESLEILKAAGVGERTARAFLGMLCRQHEEHVVVEAVQAAVGKADITAYIQGVLKAKPKKGEPPKAAARPKCAYCTAEASGTVNRIAHCREHTHDAMDEKVPA